MSATGLEKVSDVAKRNGVSSDVMLRRLKGLARKVAEENPRAPPLLIRMPDIRYGKVGRPWYLDRSVAWEHARGLVAEDSTDAWARLVDELTALKHETMRRMDEIQTELRLVRSLLAKRV